MNTAMPTALIYMRLVIGFVILGFAMTEFAALFKVFSILLLTVGLIAGVIGGVMLRRLSASNRRLKRLDSNVDQVFFLCCAAATFIQNPDFFLDNPVTLLTLVGFEALAYLVCYLKFRKEIATQSIGAKLWTLVLFATLVEIIWTGHSTYLFAVCFCIGVLSRIEIIAIVVALKRWSTDVPSIVHALRLRNGKDLKESNLQNG